MRHCRSSIGVGAANAANLTRSSSETATTVIIAYWALLRVRPFYNLGVIAQEAIALLDFSPRRNPRSWVTSVTRIDRLLFLGYNGNPFHVQPCNKRVENRCTPWNISGTIPFLRSRLHISRHHLSRRRSHA